MPNLGPIIRPLLFKVELGLMCRAISPATRRCTPWAAPRVYTTVKVNTRTDKEQTLEGKVASVRALL